MPGILETANQNPASEQYYLVCTHKRYIDKKSYSEEMRTFYAKIEKKGALFFFLFL